jgi:hypothetical protein
MVMKKAKGKGRSKKTAKKSAKKSVRSPKKPVDIVRMRENIKNLVGNSAEDIANKMIEFAKSGQLASVKYLFEAVGLYPATEETNAKPPEDSLAYTLLRRMGLPTVPVICDEDSLPSTVAIDVRGTTRELKDAAEEYPDSAGKESRKRIWNRAMSRQRSGVGFEGDTVE